MDKETRMARRRMKAARTPRGELSPFASRGLGRKNKPADFFPIAQCTAKTGEVKKVPIRRRYKHNPSETYVLMIEVGGTRCPNTARNKKLCPTHGG